MKELEYHLMQNYYTPEYFLSNFFGRNEELEILQKSLIDRGERIIAITGNNATGKTALWKVFIEMNKDRYDSNIEVIYGHRAGYEFPEISEEKELVILEDLSFVFSPRLEKGIEEYINRYSKKQFILVSPFKIEMAQFNPTTHIHLSNLDVSSTELALSKLLSQTRSKAELNEIVNLTSGNPFLIKLVANYLNSGEYNLSKIVELIQDGLNYRGLSGGDNKLLLNTSPEFELIKNDIVVVNKSILDRIKKRPDDVYKLTSRQFEEMVAELMIKRGYRVDITKATHDGGKDLIIANHTDIGNFMYYVECKKYDALRPVGVNLIRELAGTITADRVTAGLMVTSSYFSPDAIEFTEKFRYQIGLVDFIKLKEWLNT